jgi:hypothetical protein
MHGTGSESVGGEALWRQKKPNITENILAKFKASLLRTSGTWTMLNFAPNAGCGTARQIWGGRPDT